MSKELIELSLLSNDVVYTKRKKRLFMIFDQLTLRQDEDEEPQCFGIYSGFLELNVLVTLNCAFCKTILSCYSDGSFVLATRSDKITCID